MSEWKSINTLFQPDAALGETVTVKGWLRSKRDSKAGISFLAIHDGTCFDPIQAVVPNTLSNYEQEVLGLSTGCAVEVSGELVASEGKGQAVEIQASQVVVVGTVDDPESYPIAKKRHSFEYLRTQAHLRTRTNTFGAITRVRHVLASAIHRFFRSRGVFTGSTRPSLPPAIVRVPVSCSRSAPSILPTYPDDLMARWIRARIFLAGTPSSRSPASSPSSRTACPWARYTPSARPSVRKTHTLHGIWPSSGW